MRSLSDLHGAVEEGAVIEFSIYLGYAYDYDKHWRFQFDYQSGKENFFTLGFTWSLNDEFQINPAIYFSNDHPDNVAGYVVFTYTFHVWKAGK